MKHLLIARLFADLATAQYDSCNIPPAWDVVGAVLRVVSGSAPYSLGRYDACVNISLPDPTTGGMSRFAQYCTLNAAGIVYGVCLPLACSLPFDAVNNTNGLYTYLEEQLAYLPLLNGQDGSWSCGDHRQMSSAEGRGVLIYLGLAACATLLATCARHRRALQRYSTLEPEAQKGLFPLPSLGQVMEGEDGHDAAPWASTHSITGSLLAWVSKTSSVGDGRRSTRDSAGKSGSAAGAGGTGRRVGANGRPLLYSFDEEDALEQEMYTYGGSSAAKRTTPAPPAWEAEDNDTAGGGPCAACLQAAWTGVEQVQLAVHKFLAVTQQLWKGVGVLVSSFAFPAPVGWWTHVPTPLLPAPSTPSSFLEAHLPVLDMLRVVGAAWGLAGFSARFTTIPGIINVSDALLPPHGAGASPWFQGLASAALAQDTALLCTGFLATKGILAAHAMPALGSTYRPLAVIGGQMLRRLARLVPIALYTSLVFTFSLPALARGPFWYAVLQQIAPCSGTSIDLPVPGSTATTTHSATTLTAGPLWWTVPTLMNIWLPSGGGGQGAVCMPWTTTIAVATHLAVLVTPVLVFVYLRSRHAGTTLCLALVTAGLVAAQYALNQAGAHGMIDWQWLVAAIEGVPGAGSPINDVYFDNYAVQLWARAPSFLMGVLLALACHHTMVRRQAMAAMAQEARGSAGIRTGLGIETYVGLHAGPESSAALYHTPVHLSPFVCWLVQGLALSGMGGIVAAPSFALGTRDGKYQPWTSTTSTAYSVLCGPGWALCLGALLFIHFTQGPAAAVGPEGTLGVLHPAGRRLPQYLAHLHPGPDMFLGPLSSTVAWSILAPAALPAIYAGPCLILITYGVQTDWVRYNAWWLVSCVLGHVALSFGIGVLGYVVVSRPWYILLCRFAQAVLKFVHGQPSKPHAMGHGPAVQSVIAVASGTVTSPRTPAPVRRAASVTTRSSSRDGGHGSFGLSPTGLSALPRSAVRTSRLSSTDPKASNALTSPGAAAVTIQLPGKRSSTGSASRAYSSTNDPR